MIIEPELPSAKMIAGENDALTGRVAFSQRNKASFTCIDCWLDCEDDNGVDWLDTRLINGISSLTLSAWAKDNLTKGSFNKVARQFTAVGIPRVGWKGFLQ